MVCGAIQFSTIWALCSPDVIVDRGDRRPFRLGAGGPETRSQRDGADRTVAYAPEPSVASIHAGPVRTKAAAHRWRPP